MKSSDDADRSIHQYLSMTLDGAILAKQEGALPVGAVIVSTSGHVLSQGRNRVLITGDMTAHAEVSAIRQAGFGIHVDPREGSWTLFVSAEPCFMCLGAIILCPINRIVWALDHPVGSAYDIVCSSGHLPNRMAQLEVIREPIPEFRDRSRDLLLDFYAVHDPERAQLLRGGERSDPH